MTPTTELERVVAELRAELEQARNVLRKALDADIETDEPLYKLAVRASNALYWRDQMRGEAEARVAELEADASFGRAVRTAVSTTPPVRTVSGEDVYAYLFPAVPRDAGFDAAVRAAIDAARQLPHPNEPSGLTVETGDVRITENGDERG